MLTAVPEAPRRIRVNIFEEMGSGMTGLEQLRALIASGQRPPIAETLEFDLIEAREGYAMLAGVPGSRAYNFLGVVHGGYTATLLDSACGCAIHSRLSADQAFVTLELKTAFHRALTRETGLVRAEGEVLSYGRRVAFAEARLVDGRARLCATGTVTALLFERATQQHLEAAGNLPSAEGLKRSTRQSGS
jgi:uncharacterized protein (TIGR00369 family)